MTTATKTKKKPPPRRVVPKGEPFDADTVVEEARYGIEPMAAVWVRRYERYVGGAVQAMPVGEVYTLDETAFALKVEVQVKGDRDAGLRCLRRLIDLGRLDCVRFCGAGGGQTMVTRQAVAEFLRRMSGEV